MTAEDLADQLAAFLSALDDPPIAFAAENPTEPASVEAERGEFHVFVVAYAENEEPVDQYGETVREELVVSVLVNGPLLLINRHTAIAFVKFLRESLRGTEFDRYRWSGTETVTLYDFDAQKTKNQFLSLFRATYFDIR